MIGPVGRPGHRAESAPPLVGVVLAGGRSRRFGVDKARARLEGRSFVDRVADAIGAGGVDQVLVVGDGAGWLADLHPGEGPLGGVLSAAAAVPGRAVLVAPCDLPLLEGSSVAQLVQRWQRRPDRCLVARADGRWQWGLAVWTPEALRRAGRRFEAGERSLRGCLAEEQIEALELPDAQLLNVNRPVDLARRASTPTGSVQSHLESELEECMSVPEVTVQQAAAEVQGGTPLVDVREPDEFEEVRAVGAALIPLGDLTDRLDEVPEGKVLVICRSGARSLRAAEFLRASGVDAVNVAGGTLAWVDADLPVERG